MTLARKVNLIIMPALRPCPECLPAGKIVQPKGGVHNGFSLPPHAVCAHREVTSLPFSLPLQQLLGQLGPCWLNALIYRTGVCALKLLAIHFKWQQGLNNVLGQLHATWSEACKFATIQVKSVFVWKVINVKVRVRVGLGLYFTLPHFCTFFV